MSLLMLLIFSGFLFSFFTCKTHGRSHGSRYSCLLVMI